MRASNYTLRFISTRSVVGGAFKVIFQRACIRYIPVKGDKGVKIRTIPSIPNYETEQICKYTVKVRFFFHLKRNSGIYRFWLDFRAGTQTQIFKHIIQLK